MYRGPATGPFFSGTPNHHPSRIPLTITSEPVIQNGVLQTGSNNRFSRTLEGLHEYVDAGGRARIPYAHPLEGLAAVRSVTQTGKFVTFVRYSPNKPGIKYLPTSTLGR